jgi:hypothetical protein
LLSESSQQLSPSRCPRHHPITLCSIQEPTGICISRGLFSTLSETTSATKHKRCAVLCLPYHVLCVPRLVGPQPSGLCRQSCTPNAAAIMHPQRCPQHSQSEGPCLRHLPCMQTAFESMPQKRRRQPSWHSWSASRPMHAGPPGPPGRSAW